MIRLAILLHEDRRKAVRWWLATLASLLTLGAALLVIKNAVAEPQAPVVFFPAGSGRHVYLTNFDRTANTALTACSTGYHMASMWEIADISSLIYDNNHPEAYNKADSGKGPPSNWYGWVRTGFDSSTANVAGQANCAAWTSVAGGSYGTIARLTNNWDVISGALSPWEADPWTCSGTAPVWCVGDFSTLHVPLVVK